jgi:hypothetical protein
MWTKRRKIMPQVKIDSTKGLVQQTGSGIIASSGLSLTPQTIAVPAAAAAGATNTISTDVTLVILTPANGVNDRVYLPAPAGVPAGKVYFVTAVAACELSSKGDGTNVTTVNGTGVTDAAGAFAEELALAAETVSMCIRESATAWRVVTMADGGTPA